MKRRCIVLALVAAGALVAIASCSHRDEGTNPATADAELPTLRINDDTPNLMLTWIDEHGDAHVQLRPADVPAEGRGQVRVVVSNREEGTRDRFYVVDLNRHDADGTYLCQSMTRHDWEEVIAKRREAYLAKVAPPPPPTAPVPGVSGSPGAGSPPPGTASSLTVVIYGAKWCRPCHEAADYLRRKGIQVVMKDVEEDPLAQEEMQGKLAAAGQRGGSIPIIDVRGQLLVGFSASALDRAVAQALGGTTL